MGKVIIDLSHHQLPSKLDYDKLAEKVSLVIIRTQYGSATIDRHYKTHHKEFQKRGIPTNAYAWARGVSIADMEKEATDFYNRTKEFDPEVYWIDVEEYSMKDMRAGIKAYAAQLRKLGARKVGAYIAHDKYKKLNLDVKDFDAIWIPRYGKNNGTVAGSTKPSYPCDIWQYTENGRLSGYAGALDLNTLTGSKPLSFFVKKEEESDAKPSTSTTKVETYKVVKSLKAYKTSADAQEKKNPAGTVKAGTYYVFNSKTGVKNVTQKKGVAGSWIRTADNKVTSTTTSSAKYITVKAGDTAGELAKKHGSTIAKIKSWNKLNSKYTIYAGQKLRVK